MKTKTWRGWTPKQEAHLAELRAGGLPIREIAERMGRTFAAVKCQLMRSPERYPKRLRIEDYYDALQVVHTLPEVAAKFRVRVETVTHAKWKLRRKGYSVGPAAPKRKAVGQ